MVSTTGVKCTLMVTAAFFFFFFFFMSNVECVYGLKDLNL